MVNLAIREQRRITQFLHDMWRHRARIFLDSAQERKLQDELTDAILVFSLELEALYQDQDQ